MHSFKATLTGFPLAGWRPVSIFNQGPLCRIYPAGFKNKGKHTHTGEVGQQARASWGSRAFLFAPSAQRGDGASFPLVLMEPIMWIHHVATCVLLCFDILVHEITSLGKGLPPLKCSQFPLTIMGQKETYPPLLNSGGQKWNMIRFGECHRKPVGTAGMVWNGPSFIICRHIDGAGVCLTE